MGVKARDVILRKRDEGGDCAMSMTKDERNAVVELRIAKAYRAYAEAKGVVEWGY